MSRPEPGHATVRAPELLAFSRRVLERVGVPGDDAAAISEVLVETDLRGIDSHGVALLPNYVRRYQEGILNPTPEIRVVRARGATALIDGDNALGHLVARSAMTQAIERARVHGIGFVGARLSGHFGMAAYYAMMALEHDMIGYATTNASADLPPHQGLEPVLGNNPLAYAFPAGRHPDVVIDMACSAVARGKVRMAVLAGQELPEGWLVDDQGRPLTRPASFRDGFLVPAGGHKGYALAVAQELLAVALPGAAFSLDILRSPTASPNEQFDPRGVGHSFMAIDISAFRDVAEFKAAVDRLIDHLKAARPAPGFSEVLVPGEYEHRTREQRLATGIPLPASTAGALARLAEEFQLTPPW